MHINRHLAISLPETQASEDSGPQSIRNGNHPEGPSFVKWLHFHTLRSYRKIKTNVCESTWRQFTPRKVYWENQTADRIEYKIHIYIFKSHRIASYLWYTPKGTRQRQDGGFLWRRWFRSRSGSVGQGDWWLSSRFISWRQNKYVIPSLGTSGIRCQGKTHLSLVFFQKPQVES